MTSKPLPKRILIANRGEIARRIIRTCDSLGIETVAVYTEADAHAPHVSEATYSEALGAVTNYLSGQAILSAAQRAGADAIHPGYGFLSENADFADAVTQAGFLFIGPKPETIRALGSKTNAKEIARKASVPTSPTLLLTASSSAQQAIDLAAFGASVGFPLIIKAAAGGGGRGMRLVHASSSFVDELESARREALKAFGRDEIFVEKCISPARHIEVQIAGDATGAVVALGTRDCSLQRNNQKIIEEAPATNLRPGASVEMLDAASRLAREVGYLNLGTVEFLYDQNGSFYFLEVNTRLQVEHPVTEMVTGLDLVQLQLALASGETLSNLDLTSTPAVTGHAIEARLCAEEFSGQFINTTGIIVDSFIPQTDPRLRVDLGVEVCSEVTHHYDSMLGKVIAHGNDRVEAIEILTDGLRRSQISGVGNNRSLLLHLLQQTEFHRQKHSVQGTKDLLPTADDVTKDVELGHALLAATRLFNPHSSWSEASPWMQFDTYSIAPLCTPFTTSRYGVTTSSTSLRNGQLVTVSIKGSTQTLTVEVLECSYPTPHHSQCALRVGGGEVFTIDLIFDGSLVWLHTPDITVGYEQVYEEIGRTDALQTHGERLMSSLIPGRVAALCVTDGAPVNEGDTVLVLDSMKMEHPIKAPCGGLITLHVSAGTTVSAGSVLAHIRKA